MNTKNSISCEKTDITDSIDDRPLEAMFLHLDEELTNNRVGHSYNSSLTSKELSFWINFYSLFYDRVYVPANFLTDSNLVPEVIANFGSFFSSNEHPFTVIWDSSRFPYEGFRDFVKAIETGKESPDVSMRDLSSSYITADFFDNIPKSRIMKSPMSVSTFNDESIQVMKATVFNSSINSALSPIKCDRINSCLSQILEEGGAIGYGRNFYYTIFGYGSSSFDKKLEERFKHAIKDIGELQHAFLSGVDYASHTIKAKMASNALDKEIHCLLPSPYMRIFDPHQGNEYYRTEEDRYTVDVKTSSRFMIDEAAVINMTGKQFEILRRSPEYFNLRRAFNRIMRSDILQRRPNCDEIRGLLDDYLALISSTFSPFKTTGVGIFESMSNVRMSEMGYQIGISLMKLASWILPEPLSGISRNGVDLLAEHRNIVKISDAIQGQHKPKEMILSEGFQLSNQVFVRIK